MNRLKKYYSFLNESADLKQLNDLVGKDVTSRDRFDLEDKLRVEFVSDTSKNDAWSDELHYIIKSTDGLGDDIVGRAKADGNKFVEIKID